MCDGGTPADGDLVAADGKIAVPPHVAAAIRTLIEWAGDDPTREGLVDTPLRSGCGSRPRVRGSGRL